MNAWHGTVSVCAVVLVAGCLGGLAGGDRVDERAFPDRPPELTEETAGPFVVRDDTQEGYEATSRALADRVERRDS